MRARSASLVGMAIAVLPAVVSCANEYHPEFHPVSSYTVNQSLSYPTVYQVGSASISGPGPVAEPPSEPPPASPAPVADEPPAVDPSRVTVVESPRLDRNGEVVAVLDVQDPTVTRASGEALLRERAAELGADAVVSVEFHRGDGGRPARVSGLAVRFDRRGRR
ncbi:MAG: hypothetical protein ACRELB_10750 [Polyangiaceae bacterium]